MKILPNWINRLFNWARALPPRAGEAFSYILPRQAGVHVDHDTALRLSAVFGCSRVIAETVAMLPWHVYVPAPGNRRERIDNSTVATLLNHRPNPEMTPFTFKETIVGWAVTWGNGYAEIERDIVGRAVALWPISPDRVEVKRDENGRLYYEVSNSSGEKSRVPARDMYHLHGLGFDGLVGYSVISYAAQSIGLGMAAETFGSSFFGNGAQLGGILNVPEGSTMSPDAKANLHKTFNRQHRGPTNAHKVELLDAGITFQTVGIPPEDAQFLETRKFQVEEICRWYRVPPHKVASLDHATFSNIEHQSIEFVTDTIMPWAMRAEQEANIKLLSGRQYSKLNINALLRGDSASRSMYYKTMWEIGVYSVNDILELEDRNPVENGDKRFVPMNMTTLEQAGEEPPPQEPPPQEPPAEQAAAAQRPAMRAEMARMLKREAMVACGARKRYSDRVEFAEWIDTGGYSVFLSELKNTVKNHLYAILGAMGVDQAEHIADESAAVYVARHKEDSRRYLFRVYDGEVIETDGRAEQITDVLLQSAYQYARACYGNQVQSRLS